MDQQQQQNRRRAVEAGGGLQNHPPPQPCPRCNSNNTKFCYYNNYSLSQPRFFCKGCRRYWTQGGTLRNVPVGGGCRKSKRPKLASTSSGISGPGESSQHVSPATMLNNPLILNPHDQRVSLINSTNTTNNNNNNNINGSTTNNTSAGTMMMGHSYFGGGNPGFLPSLAAIQGVNQQQLTFGPNLGLLHGFGLTSFDHQPPQHHPNQLQDVSLPSLFSTTDIGPSSTPSMQDWNLRIGSGSVPGSEHGPNPGPGPIAPGSGSSPGLGPNPGPGPVAPDPNGINNNQNRNQNGNDNTQSNQHWPNFMGRGGLDDP